MKSLADRLDELAPEQRAFVEGRMRAARAGATGGIPRRDSHSPAPLSCAQELVYRIQRSAPDSFAYNIPRALRIDGELDVPRLEAALAALVERHAILRTTFSQRDGTPLQTIGPPRPATLRSVSLAALTDDERDAELARTLRDASEEPFDLGSDLPLRALLVRLAETEHVLLLIAHHVAWDLTSHDIALADIARAYDANAGGASPLTLQYADFAAWQRETVSGARLAELFAYWKKELAGVPDVVALPTDKPRPVVPDDAGIRATTTLPRTLVDAITALGAREGATSFTTFAAAFATLLHRYAAADDVVLGCAVAGRTRPELEPLVGYFSNMLPLRARFADDPNFPDLLHTFRETFLEATQWAELPYEQLAVDVLPRRTRAVAPLFGAAFDLRHAARALPSLGGAVPVPFAIERCVAKFDLSLTVVLTSGGATLELKGRADLFELASLERMLRHFTVLLEAILAAPEQPVSRLRLLATDERAMMLDGNTSPVHYPDARLDALIRAQAARRPDAVALEYDGADADAEVERLTYAQLVARAERLARRLRAHGVGPGVGVGLFAERSLEQVVGMLGVLTAGGYYVPLDPDYPPERVAFMLADARAPVLLTLERLRPALPVFGDRDQAPVVLALDTESMDASGRDPAPLSAGGNGNAHADVAPLGNERRSRSSVAAAVRGETLATSPDDLAYTIYTSGSTGQPKGVMVAHRAVINYVLWMRDAYGVDARDAILQRAAASFDASVWEFFLPLIAGARLVLARRDSHGDPAYLRRVLERRAISLLQLVPAQLAAQLDVPGSSAALGRLRRLFLGGEALPADLLRRVLAACPELPVTNLYGPTEATVYATHWDVDPSAWDGRTVPLGTPISNVTVNVLDAHLEPVPPGVAGELCIGGAGLAQGYLDRPQLTAERFVTARGGADGAAVRLYRTGDRGRRRPDGTLEFLGRLDTQIKLHGFRIELGEVEHALGADPEVRAAVVVIGQNAAGDPRLVAYCLPARGRADAATSDERAAPLRQRLGLHLPAFMVPSAIVWLDSWPLGATGKLDRAALPEVADVPAAERIIVAPRTATETRLAALWSAALGLAEVGTAENFFDLGGHSLAAMRILARIDEAFAMQISLRAFFERPTVAQMAAHLDELRRSGSVVAGPALRRIARVPLPQGTPR